MFEGEMSSSREMDGCIKGGRVGDRGKGGGGGGHAKKKMGVGMKWDWLGCYCHVVEINELVLLLVSGDWVVVMRSADIISRIALYYSLDTRWVENMLRNLPLLRSDLNERPLRTRARHIPHPSCIAVFPV